MRPPTLRQPATRQPSMRLPRSRPPWLASLLLAGVAAVAVAPLLLQGVSCGHDIDFHLLNWLEAAEQLRHGNLHPHWAATPAWNAGEPRFVFYPPLSWTVGALLALLARLAAHTFPLAPATAFAATPVVYTYLVLLLAGIALFRACRPLAGRDAALVAASLYITNPYALFSAYERTAYAEMLAMALFPALFALLLPRRPGAGGQSQPSVVSLAAVVALLWLSNAPAAVMGCYALALLAVLRIALLLHQRQPRTIVLRFAARTGAGSLLGFALPAFFLAPALAERPAVQLSMAVLPGMRLADNTLFHHTGDLEHDHVLHTASLIAVLLLAASLLALAAALARGSARRAADANTSPSRSHTPQSLPQIPTLLILAIVSAIIALLLTPIAVPLWPWLPQLSFLQFPWRLLALQAAILALAVALALRGLTLRPTLVAGLCLGGSALLTSTVYRFTRQVCDAEDTPQARFARFYAPAPQQRGSDPTDEYTPAAADNDALADSNAPFRLLAPSEPEDTAISPARDSGPAPQTLDLTLARPALLVLNLRDYPAWLVLRNDRPLTERHTRADGLLAIPLPAGVSHLRLVYHTSPIERAGDLTSLGALLVLLVLWRRERTAQWIDRPSTIV